MLQEMKLRELLKLKERQNEQEEARHIEATHKKTSYRN
jgi:hypothetical protein